MIEAAFNLLGFRLYETGDPRSMVGRSPRWPSLRKQFLEANPACCVSGLKVDLEVHHVKPFHLNPDLELSWDNLRTVSRPYHFLIGHLCDWQSINVNFDTDVGYWRQRITRRPRNGGAKDEGLMWL